MVIVKGNVYLTVILIEDNVYVFLDIKLFLQEHVYKSDNQDALILTKSHLLMVNVDVSKDSIVIKILVYHSAHNLIKHGMEELVIVFQDLLDLDLINLVYLQSSVDKIRDYKEVFVCVLMVLQKIAIISVLDR